MTLALPAATTQSDDAVASVSAEYRDPAPMITRQHPVVEGRPTLLTTAEHINDCLAELSVVTDLIVIIEQYFRTTELMAREF
jgi:hypothetical protein